MSADSAIGYHIKESIISMYHDVMPQFISPIEFKRFLSWISSISTFYSGEVSEALFNKNEINDSISRELKKELGEMKKMPRAAPVDPEMRKKYNKELDAIENELEKIYSDPIGVWTEFMKNPEKFLEEGEMGNLADDEDFQ